MLPDVRCLPHNLVPRRTRATGVVQTRTEKCGQSLAARYTLPRGLWLASRVPALVFTSLRGQRRARRRIFVADRCSSKTAEGSCNMRDTRESCD